MGALDMLNLMQMAGQQGQKIGTPGINPNAPDPRPNAQPSKLDSFIGSPGGGFLMYLLAQSGYSPIPHSPCGAIGRAALLSQQQGQQRKQSDLQNELLRARIGLTKKQTDVASKGQRIVQSAQTLANGNIGYLDAFTGQVVDTGIEAAGDGQIIDMPGLGQVRFDKVRNTLTQVNPEDVIQTGKEGRAQATEAGKQSAITSAIPGQEQARKDPGRKRALPTSLLRAQETIDEVDKVIAEIESGELSTGPIQGAFSQYKPGGELLRKLGNTKVLDLISQATFGALSEGERSFLDKIAFGLGKTEEFNVDELKKFKRILQKAMEIEQRDASRLDVGGDAISEAEAIADKY